MTTAAKDITLPVDLLGRQEIVERILKILEVISEKKSSCTFALNGAWGTGKTFVLNMLMNQLWEYHSDKYIVFHYNCWQYDYYEEPLIAIVAAMLDSVDEENHLLPANLRDKAKAGMELAKPVLKKIATDFVKNKIGVDLTDVVSTAKDYKEALDTEEQKKAETRSFDEFYSFKKAIQQAQNEISKLTKNCTLVVVVDELDRCLPDYAIKVLERLHHLFASVENCAILLAVDKHQLDQTVTCLFGANTDSTKYLRKFINIELELDTGTIAHGFREKYHDYFEMFDEGLLCTDFPYDYFFNTLFSCFDSRTRERIMDRIKTVHAILFPNKKKDYSFCCGELLWAISSEYISRLINPFTINVDRSKDKPLLRIKNTRTPPVLETNHIEKMMNDLLQYDGNRFFSYFARIDKENIDTVQMTKLLLHYMECLYPTAHNGEHEFILSYSSDHYVDSINSNITDFKDYKRLLEIIK